MTMKPESGVLDIGNATQLLLDRRLCSESEGIRLVMNRPVRTGEVLLEPTELEKTNRLCYDYCCSVLQENGVTRLWYYANNQDEKSRRRLCYAESDDGVVFRRPTVNPRTNVGLDLPNAVIDDPVQGGCVWIDPFAPPAERYRSQAKWGPPGKYPGKGSSFHFYGSPDGFSWKETHHLHIGDCDTQSVVFYDESYGRYVLYTRTWKRFEDHNLSSRKVRRLESDDLVNWSNEQIVWEADAHDLARYVTSVGKPPVDCYGACVFKYPGAGNLYIMVAQHFWHWQDRPEHEKWGYSPDPENLDRTIVHLAPAVIDARLAYSYDGIHFERPIDRGPFLGVGPDGRFDSRWVWVLPNPVIREHDIWFYYYGGNRDHDHFVDSAATERLSGIGRAVMRRDAFVSAEADLDGGWLMTPLLRYNPGTLEVNAAASAGGYVKVEVFDEQSRPIPGLSGKDSVRLCGDSVRLPVRWNSREFEKTANRPVRFKFYLREARLFSFTVSAPTTEP